MKTILITALALAFATPALAQTAPTSVAPTSAANEIHAENCMVKFIHNVDVPAEVDGKVMELKFDEGSTVAAGELMVVIDDTQAKFALELKKAEEKEALLNATNDVNLKDSKNAEDLARAELEAFKELRREGAIPFWELEKKRFEATRAELKIDLAEMQMQIAKVQFKAKENERQMAEYEIKKRRITAPFAGYVEARLAQLGEWVQPGTPVATLVQLDKLKVEGYVDALRYSDQVVKGMPAQVRVYREASNENAVTFNAKIDFVGSEIGLDKRYRVSVNIDNKQAGEQWLVKPGMRAEIIVLK
ncbi:Multidrug resistance protein MdtA precursor [Novipirellula galeiformis]|uniref:Multidrug resistance protein MdtA n=1 Tax=Novipirellula galeiformis TaxID=2528004 RepID=A0A5C6CFE2_9BACT|nr:HlyD family efflux transporter periplasmic adaptor subunit [Novipirellula galeiformis]TWU23340.1 Multidrug resistance protein MdtA precursor [Novipirellula galeiformis]